MYHSSHIYIIESMILSLAGNKISLNLRSYFFRSETSETPISVPGTGGMYCTNVLLYDYGRFPATWYTTCTDLPVVKVYKYSST